MIGDPPSGSTVAEGIPPSCESSIGLRIVEKPGDGALNCVCARPHELAHARFDTLRAFGFVAQDQHRATQRRHFLLDASRVCEDEVRAIHQPDEWQIFQWLEKVHAWQLPENSFDWPTHMRVRMHGIDNYDVVSPRRQVS